MKKENLVSIIIPSFNRATLIGETLDSIIAQTYPNWECIIVDDGSSDNTVEVIKDYITLDNRFSLYQREQLPKGAPTCRNIGLKQTKGKYIIFFDSDDLFAENCLENRLKIAQQKELDFYLFQGGIFLEKIGDNPNLIGSPKTNEKGEIGLAEYLEPSPRWCNPSALWQKEAIQKLAWDESLKVWQDVELYCRAIIEQYQFEFFDGAPDFYWRHHFDDKDRISNRRLSSPYINSKLLAIQKLIELCDSQDQKTIKRIMTKDMFRVLEQNLIEQETSKIEFRTNLSLYLNIVNPRLRRGLHSTYFRTIYWLKKTKIPYLKGLLAKTVGKMLKSAL